MPSKRHRKVSQSDDDKLRCPECHLARFCFEDSGAMYGCSPPPLIRIRMHRYYSAIVKQVQGKGSDSD